MLNRVAMLLTPLLIGVVLAQEPISGGTLRIAIYSEPPGLNFQTFTGIPAYQLSRSIYDTLARWNPATGEYEPALATAWVQESPTAWVFTLRQGVQFHRGYGEMTAEDVAFSYNNIIQNNLGQSWAMAFIDHVEVVDTYTVRFVLKSPFATFFANAIGGPLGVMSAKAYEELGPEAFARNPVGTGPFALANWVSGDRIVLERNDSYWREGLPYLDAIEFRIIPDSFVRLSLLRTGEIDFTDAPDYRELPFLLQEPGLKVANTGGWGWDYLSFNTTLEPGNDALVRQALSYAIDREQLAQAVYAGYADATDTPIPSNFPAGREGMWRYPSTADPQKARDLLTEAGYPDGVTLSVITYDSDNLRRELQIIADQARRAGITLEITQADRPTYNQAVNSVGGAMPYNIEMGNISLIGPDEDTALYTFQYTGNLRWHGWDDPEKDALLNQARSESDREVRNELYEQLMTKMLDDQPYVFTVMPNIVRVMSDRVEGFTLDPKDWDLRFDQTWLRR